MSMYVCKVVARVHNTIECVIKNYTMYIFCMTHYVSPKLFYFVCHETYVSMFSLPNFKQFT